MTAAMEGMTENVIELVKAGSDMNMQNKVCLSFSLYLWMHHTHLLYGTLDYNQY